VMRFYRQRPMSSRTFRKASGWATPPARQKVPCRIPAFRVDARGAPRDRCSCASNSAFGFVTKRTVIFALPLIIERANDVSTAINDAVLGGRSRHVHTGRTGADRAGGCDICPSDRYNRTEKICCKSSADFGIGRFR